MKKKYIWTTLSGFQKMNEKNNCQEMTNQFDIIFQSFLSQTFGLL